MSNQTPLPEHQGLSLPPSSFDSSEQCEEHEETLSMFCLDDLEPLCNRCADGNHAGHRVYLLTEAAVDCKEELRTSVNGLNKKIIHLKKVSQTCQHASEYNQAEAKLTEEHMKTEFEKLHQFLRQEEADRMLALRQEREEKKRQAEERTDAMDQVIKCLEDKIQLIEEVLDEGGDGVEFLQHYQDTVNSTCSGHREPEDTCTPLIDVAKHLGNLQYAVWEKMKHIAPYTPVTLDPRTAGQSLRVSPGLNSVQITPGPSQWLEENTGEVVPVPANAERFHPYSCILAREGFNTGVHCWDVEVGYTDNWTLGVAAQSVSRKAEFEACPEAGLWCITQRDGEYRALTTPTQILHLDNSRHLNKVHVRLDWDEGMLEFMNADTNAHIFTFRHCFSEMVYPYFESVSVGGSLAVLAQRVNVRVGSDCVPVEDTDIVREGQAMKSESSADIITASTVTSSKVVKGQMTKNKKSAVCSMKEQKTTKPTKKDKTSNNNTSVKKQTCKPRFSANYHISLNRALNNMSNGYGDHKQTHINHDDNMSHCPCDK